MRVGRFAAVLFLLVASGARAEAPGVYAIINGTVHPVSGPEIPNGVVVVRDGLIESVGSGITIPADAMTIDAQGGHVYPGLINAQTSLGFAAPRARTRGQGQAGQRPTESDTPVVTPNPAFVSLDNVRFTNEDADDWRRVGVTTIVTAPASDIFNGQSVLLNLGDGETMSNAIRSPASMQISFTPRRRLTYPDSLMGVMAYLRQTFMDAQQRTAALNVYQKTPSGLQRPEANRSLDALGPVMRRELPVVFIADTAEMIRRAQTIAREFNLRYVISGGRQAYKMVEELKDVPVLVSVNWATTPSFREDREEQPLRVIRDRQLAPTTPSVLARNNVPFALVSSRSSEFLRGIRKAVTNGLSHDDALRATTLAPARIFGVDRQLGSLERGKIANVIVVDRPIFASRARVKRVFVDGREIRVEERAAPARTISPARGTWNLTVNMPTGAVSIIATLDVEEGRVTGTFSGDRGSGNISDGSFEDGILEFAISARVEAETSDWFFRGTIRDNSITGTVSTNLGTFEFSGSKGR
jgi:imidazolonepropionase-like amidohydrolase